MAQHVIILDGGTGRELKAIGAPFRQPEWSAAALIDNDGPPFVTRVHERFADAGAEVITTNSYALVPFHIGEARWRARGSELATLAGALARRVAAARPGLRVAGCLPPVCGSYRADLFDANVAAPVLTELVRSLAPFVDFYLAETLSSIAEVQQVHDVLAAERAAAVDLGGPTPPSELWVSFTIDDEGVDSTTLAEGNAQQQPAPLSPRLRSGEGIADAVAAALQCGASAVLFNCSQPEVMSAAVTVAVATVRGAGSTAHVGVYANAFPPQRASTATANETIFTTREDITPIAYANFARDWVRHGATIVGGCCGIGAEHIAALRDAKLDSLLSASIIPHHAA